MNFLVPLASAAVAGEPQVIIEDMQTYADFWGIRFGGGTVVDGTWLLVVFALGLIIIGFFVSRTIISVSQKKMQAQQMTKEMITGIVSEQLDKRIRLGERIQELLQKISDVRDFVGDSTARKTEVDGLRRDLVNLQRDVSKMQGEAEARKDMQRPMTTKKRSPGRPKKN